MNRNATLHTRKNAKRDPLQGAPGHTASDNDETDAVQMAEDVSAAEETSSQSSIAEDLIQKLGSVFGEDTIEKWRSVLSANTADAQAAFYGILRSRFPELPEEFSLSDITKLADWKPAQKVKQHPVASAATVAAGVGAFFLVREYLNRNPDTSASRIVSDAAQGLRKAAKRAVKLAAAASVAAPVVQAASNKMSSKSKSNSKVKGQQSKAKSDKKGSKAKSRTGKKSKKR